MRKNIHPGCGPVIFRDRSARTAFLTRWTIRPHQTMVWTDGQTYPVCDVDVSSASHPYWTGKEGRVLDTVGRVEAFERRYGGGERR